MTLRGCQGVLHIGGAPLLSIWVVQVGGHMRNTKDSPLVAVRGNDFGFICWNSFRVS